MPPFFPRNFAYGNVARHNGIVVESNAYFFPGMSRILVVRFSQASFIIYGWLSQELFLL